MRKSISREVDILLSPTFLHILGCLRIPQGIGGPELGEDCHQTKTNSKFEERSAQKSCRKWQR